MLRWVECRVVHKAWPGSWTGGEDGCLSGELRDVCGTALAAVDIWNTVTP